MAAIISRLRLVLEHSRCKSPSDHAQLSLTRIWQYYLDIIKYYMLKVEENITLLHLHGSYVICIK